MPDAASSIAINWPMATIRKVSVRLGGHATSFSLEESFLAALKAMAARRNVAFSRFVAQIDAARPPHVSLSSALRLAVLHDLCKTGHL